MHGHILRRRRRAAHEADAQPQQVGRTGPAGGRHRPRCGTQQRADAHQRIEHVDRDAGPDTQRRPDAHPAPMTHALADGHRKIRPRRDDRQEVDEDDAEEFRSVLRHQSRSSRKASSISARDRFSRLFCASSQSTAVSPGCSGRCCCRWCPSNSSDDGITDRSATGQPLTPCAAPALPPASSTPPARCPRCRPGRGSTAERR